LWIGFGILLAIGFVAKAILPYIGDQNGAKERKKEQGKGKDMRH
jgi:hypothetical protein